MKPTKEAVNAAMAAITFALWLAAAVMLDCTRWVALPVVVFVIGVLFFIAAGQEDQT